MQNDFVNNLNLLQDLNKGLSNAQKSIREISQSLLEHGDFSRYASAYFSGKQDISATDERIGQLLSSCVDYMKMIALSRKANEIVGYYNSTVSKLFEQLTPISTDLRMLFADADERAKALDLYTQLSQRICPAI